MAAREVSIWWWAFGYFATYVPYSALTKALSSGALWGQAAHVDGVTLLPSSAIASVLTTGAFLAMTGWWRDASVVRVGGLDVPRPSWWTGLSGLCSAVIMVTTTLAYTIEGTSIVLMMLIMRGTVLAIAPVVDLLSRRRVRTMSWVALALSFCALLVAFRARGSLDLSPLALLDLSLYGTAYFVRLRVMSHAAKSDAGSRRFFVEEQLVCTPAVLATLVVWAIVGRGAAAEAMRAGFTDFLAGPYGALGLFIGVCSQGTGVFGGLVLLDTRENTFCIPVNRASSVLAGVVASLGLWAFLPRMSAPAAGDLLGACLMIAALAVLALPTRSPVAARSPR